MNTLFFHETGNREPQDQGSGRPRARVLVQGGSWIVPVGERPAGWETMLCEGLLEHLGPAPASATPQNVQRPVGGGSGMEYEIDFANSEANETAGQVDRLADDIAALRTKEAEALYDIGWKLIGAKAMLGHGELLSFLEDSRVGYLPRMAQMLMAVARAEDGRELARYGIAKASALLKLTPARRKSVLREFDLNLLSVSELHALIRQILGKRSPAGRRGNASVEGTAGAVENEIAWAAGVLHLSIEELSENAVESAFREL